MSGQAKPLDQLHADARAIFTHALRECAVPAAFDRHIRFEGTNLIRQSSPKPISLDRYREILVIALGKAALPMTETLLSRLAQHLPAGIPINGVCSAPVLPTSPAPNIRYFTGGHPLPNADSFEAAREALRLLREAGSDTFVFFLVSGGGSAMFELPLDPAISLEDTIAFHRALVGSGATITEINTVRKYFSAAKGGKLAHAAPQSDKLSLLISDVPPQDVASIASSPTLPDQSTPEQCREILDRFHLPENFPPAVREYFAELHPDPPSAGAPGLAVETWENSSVEVLLSNDDLVAAARNHALSLGYRVVIDNTCDDRDYRDASAYLLRRFHELRRDSPRLCLLSGGEVTVALGPTPGRGGRSQQFALAAAFQLAQNPDDPAAVLSAGSDGIDGNSPAAGAIVDPTTLARARVAGIAPEPALARFDTYLLFAALGDVILTGPTGNNLRDLRILLAL